MLLYTLSIPPLIILSQNLKVVLFTTLYDINFMLVSCLVFLSLPAGIFLLRSSHFQGESETDTLSTEWTQVKPRQSISYINMYSLSKASFLFPVSIFLEQVSVCLEDNDTNVIVHAYITVLLLTLTSYDEYMRFNNASR